MNWEKYQVEDWELDALIKHNRVIEVNGNPLTPNAGVEITTPTGKRYNAIYDPELRGIRKLNTSNPQFKDMQNRDLVLYNDLLTNPNVTTIIVDGFFGTGKTSTVSSHLVHGLLAELRGESDGIPKAYISKPHVGIGQGYGHLPGDLHDKTLEEFKSFTQYFDRFGSPGLADILMMRSVEEEGRFMKELTKDYEAKGLVSPMLELLPFEYLRGRDIPEGWVILDEAQNTNDAEMASFISRLGDDAKTIILGDSTITQIDRRGNTSQKNGLIFAKEIYKNKKYAGYVEFQTLGHILRGERVRDLFRYLRMTGIA